MKNVLGVHLGVIAADIDESCDLVRTYQLDSLDLVELVIRLEEATGVVLTDAELAAADTLSDLAVTAAQRSSETHRHVAEQ